MMKKYFLIIIIFVFYLVSCEENIINNNNFDPLEEIEVSEGNFWTPTATLPDTGNTTHFVSTHDITVNELNYIFVATDFAGIFRSTNNGNSWSIQNNGFAGMSWIPGEINYFTSAVVSLNGYLFACTDSAIYVSQNNGNSWLVNKKFDDFVKVVLFKPKNQGEIYAGCYNGVLKTNDFGNHWIDISRDLDWNQLWYAYDLEFTKNGTLYIATAKGLARTSNDGLNWEYLGIQDQTLDVEVSDKGYILTAVQNDLYISKDDGDTWESIFNVDYMVTYVLINKVNTVFVCCHKGIYRSKDEGMTWELIGLNNLSPIKIFYDRVGNLVAGTFRKGVFISHN